MKYNRKAYKEWHDKVQERDDFTCQYCPIRNPEYEPIQGREMESHHVYGKVGDRRLNVDNGICLCPECHRFATDHGRIFREWFEETYPERVRKVKGF